MATEFAIMLGSDSTVGCEDSFGEPCKLFNNIVERKRLDHEYSNLSYCRKSLERKKVVGPFCI